MILPTAWPAPSSCPPAWSTTSRCAGKRYRAIAQAMGVEGLDAMTDDQAADAAIAAVKKLSSDVGIPQNLQGILKEEDVAFLAKSAYADACCPGNPRDTSEEEIAGLYRSLL